MTAAAYTSTPSETNGIRRSFNPYIRSTHAVGGERPISYGDKLFARIVMHGRTIVELMVNSVNDLTELWGELRRQARGACGLAKLYLRNMSQGWSIERPLMLYPDRRRSVSNNSGNNSYHVSVRQSTSPVPSRSATDDLAIDPKLAHLFY